MTWFTPRCNLLFWHKLKLWYQNGTYLLVPYNTLFA
uniref:Uncharacterized protein n=1 Tax=Arundo donax TaxID=35708 RepID=A0A0A9BIY1_ARUDO